MLLILKILHQVNLHHPQGELILILFYLLPFYAHVLPYLHYIHRCHALLITYLLVYPCFITSYVFYCISSHTCLPWGILVVMFGIITCLWFLPCLITCLLILPCFISLPHILIATFYQHLHRNPIQFLWYMCDRFHAWHYPHIPYVTQSNIFMFTINFLGSWCWK